MTRRGLVLNGGLAWTSYQVGALRYLVRDRGLHFDVVAGTAIGAMNAAFVACGAFDDLERVWDDLRLRRMLRPNLSRSFLRGPLVASAQRRVVARSVGEDRLERRGVSLVISACDLVRAEEVFFRYPGASLPLVDAVMGAAATPGLVPPVDHDGRQLVEGSIVDNFPIAALRDEGCDEIYAVVAALPPDPYPPDPVAAWPAVGLRALEMNQNADVTSGLSAVAAWDTPPTVHAVSPSKRLEFPMWRFSRADLAAARELGYADAKRAVG